ncbi:MAG: flagellar hook-basal body complex protein FliE [Lachnospiraceae bacterium]|nr:flagellar hook-basal body complex protein FliE [Lachnospiraceae bacterium]
MAYDSVYDAEVTGLAPGIGTFRNISSRVIRQEASEIGAAEEGQSFTGIFQAALDNINTTNGYLSDAEDEEIKWALGESENTHDMAIALQKAQTALQYTVAVRDRVIAAYREIMQMQV